MKLSQILLNEIFLENVYPEPNIGCWIWCGPSNKEGYSNFQIGGFRSGHRYAYFHYKGEFNKSLHVLHKCDNPWCVNPDHLFLGTHKDNMDDRTNKKRHKVLHGSDNGNSKLTADQVLEIRRLHNPKTYPTRKLAKMFNVNQRLIFNILHRTTWKHI
jgi:hypothetical protein